MCLDCFRLHFSACIVYGLLYYPFSAVSCSSVLVVDTAVYQRQTRQLRLVCGRRNGTSLLNSLLKGLHASGLS